MARSLRRLGHDTVRENTRREYRRLLTTFALRYFDRELRVRDLDRAAVQRFVDWLTSLPGRNGRLCDRSVANALTPLRAALDAAVAEGLLRQNPAERVVLPRRRGGGWAFQERRFLTREELPRLLAEVPPKWRPLFDLLAATGLRISEAIALRWSDLELESDSPRLRVSRAIVRGVVGAPKSRHGARCVPLPRDLATTLGALRPAEAPDDALVFPGRAAGGSADVGSLRRRVLAPAAERAGLSGIGFHTLRHTCASLLIESGFSVLRLQRWMGHHSPAFTLERYGHLLDDDLGPALDLRRELRAGRR